MPITLQFRPKSPLCSHLTQHFPFAYFSRACRGNPELWCKSQSHWYLLVCFRLSLWGSVDMTGRSKRATGNWNPLTFPSDTQESAKWVCRECTFSSFMLGVLFILGTIFPKCLRVAIWFSHPENLLKRDSSLLSIHLQALQMAISTLHSPPHNIIDFCLHCFYIYFTAQDMPNHMPPKYLLLATNLSS